MLPSITFSQHKAESYCCPSKQAKHVRNIADRTTKIKTAEKRTDMKGNGEKKRYTHLNAEFQRKARRDKKAFLSD